VSTSAGRPSPSPRWTPRIAESARRIDATIAEKRRVVRWRWIHGRSGNAGNERADALAREGARAARAEAGDPSMRST